MIQKIERTVFITSDGSEFTDKENAISREAAIKVAGMLNDADFYFSPDGVSRMEIAEWFIRNHTVIGVMICDQKALAEDR